MLNTPASSVSLRLTFHLKVESELIRWSSLIWMTLCFVLSCLPAELSVVWSSVVSQMKLISISLSGCLTQWWERWRKLDSSKKKTGKTQSRTSKRTLLKEKFTQKWKAQSLPPDSPSCSGEAGQSFALHKTFLELHSKTELQRSPKQIKKIWDWIYKV